MGVHWEYCRAHHRIRHSLRQLPHDHITRRHPRAQADATSNHVAIAGGLNSGDGCLHVHHDHRSDGLTRWENGQDQDFLRNRVTAATRRVMFPAFPCAAMDIEPGDGASAITSGLPGRRQAARRTARAKKGRACVCHCVCVHLEPRATCASVWWGFLSIPRRRSARHTRRAPG